MDVYQIGNLVLRLICGRTAGSRSAPLFWSDDATRLEIEDLEFPKRLLEQLSISVERYRDSFISGNTWLDERVREMSSDRFLVERLAPLIASCLAPNPADRPGNCFLLLSALRDLGLPVVGCLVDSQGMPVINGLFPAVVSQR